MALIVRAIVSSSLLLLISANRRTLQTVTPVAKVIELLKKIQAEVEEDGKAEATAYDKYACFCKDQADGKNYAIEQSEKKLEKLDATITTLSGEIDELTNDVKVNNEKIDELTDEISTEKSNRAADHKKNMANIAEAKEGVGAVKAAIGAMKEFKGKMDAETVDVNQQALLQVRAVADLAMQKFAQHREQFRALSELSKVPPGTAYEYTYHSNDIIDALQNLLKMFIGYQEDLENNEFEAKKRSDDKLMGLSNERENTVRERDQQEAILAEKTHIREVKTTERAQENKEKEADQAFMQVLVSNCQDKAVDWDTRSKSRADELTAISGALDLLETKVKKTYSANEKLVELQQGRAQARAASFLQLMNSHRATKGESPKRALALLSDAAGRLPSQNLATVALKAQVLLATGSAADHFVKVRGLIKDLIDRLNADAKEEQTEKSVCDDKIKHFTGARDTAKLELEKETRTSSEATGEIKGLSGDITDLSKQISDDEKAKAEETQLRAEDKEKNTFTVKTANEGLEAVTQALRILRAFYNSKLLQTDYVPPKADREGKTVKDLAPETYGAWEKKTDAATNIVSLLEVIQADFQRTVDTVSASEEAAATKSAEFIGDLDSAITANGDTKTTKEGDKLGEEDRLGAATDKINQLEKDLKEAEENLLEAKHDCIDSEPWDVRAARREEEIEALKEAHRILEDWTGA